MYGLRSRHRCAKMLGVELTSGHSKTILTIATVRRITPPRGNVCLSPISECALRICILNSQLAVVLDDDAAAMFIEAVNLDEDVFAILHYGQEVSRLRQGRR